MLFLQPNLSFGGGVCVCTCTCVVVSVCVCVYPYACAYMCGVWFLSLRPPAPVWAGWRVDGGWWMVNGSPSRSPSRSPSGSPSGHPVGVCGSRVRPGRARLSARCRGLQTGRLNGERGLALRLMCESPDPGVRRGGGAGGPAQVGCEGRGQGTSVLLIYIRWIWRDL